MEALEIDARNRTEIRPRVFIPEDVGKVFSAGFLDGPRCRDWILTEIHGRGERYCPECHIPLTGIVLQRFGEGKRVCCRVCGKYFWALTGTFLAGCHMNFQEIILFAVFLHHRIPAREIARILRISPETVRLWEIKFQALERVKMMQTAETGEDHTDDACPCDDPDCNRPFGYAEEALHA